MEIPQSKEIVLLKRALKTNSVSQLTPGSPLPEGDLEYMKEKGFMTFHRGPRGGANFTITQAGLRRLQELTGQDPGTDVNIITHHDQRGEPKYGYDGNHLREKILGTAREYLRDYKGPDEDTLVRAIAGHMELPRKLTQERFARRIDDARDVYQQFMRAINHARDVYQTDLFFADDYEICEDKDEAPIIRSTFFTMDNASDKLGIWYNKRLEFTGLQGQELRRHIFLPHKSGIETLGRIVDSDHRIEETIEDVYSDPALWSAVKERRTVTY